MKNIPSISEAEFKVMKAIWANAPISTNQVVEMLSETVPWSAKTIQTLLARLVKKGVLEYQKNGRVFVYTPAFDQEDYLDRESSSFLDRFYGGTLNSMVVNFLDRNKLSKKDIEALKKILDDSTGERGHELDWLD